MSRRTERIGNLIRNTIGEIIISKLSDPRIDPVKTSITHVEVPEDLQSAKVHVSIAGPPPVQRKTLRALQHAAGHIQQLLARQVELRFTPVLVFLLDTKYKKTLETLSIIHSVTEQLREEQSQPDDDDTDRSEQSQ